MPTEVGGLCAETDQDVWQNMYTIMAMLSLKSLPWKQAQALSILKWNQKTVLPNILM